MLWVLTALLAAVGFTALSLIAKKVLETSSSIEYATVYSLLAVLVYAPLLVYFLDRQPLILNQGVILSIILSGTANTLGIITTSRALKHGEVSVVTPLIRTQPVFTAILGFLFLSESLGFSKLSGVTLVTVGGYLLLLRQGEDVRKPAEKLFNDRAAQMAVATALIYSAANVVNRFATQQLSPYLYTFFIFLVMATSLTAYNYWRRRELENLYHQFQSQPLLYPVIGVLAVVSLLSLFYSFSLAEASRVVPVRQVQVLLTVIGGGVIFKEKDIKRKLAASVLLLAGVAIIALQPSIPV